MGFKERLSHEFLTLNLYSQLDSVATRLDAGFGILLCENMPMSIK